jgi:phytoene dehydrogenase-like protein
MKPSVLILGGGLSGIAAAAALAAEGCSVQVI